MPHHLASSFAHHHFGRSLCEDRYPPGKSSLRWSRDTLFTSWCAFGKSESWKLIWRWINTSNVYIIVNYFYRSWKLRKSNADIVLNFYFLEFNVPGIIQLGFIPGLVIYWEWIYQEYDNNRISLLPLYAGPYAIPPRVSSKFIRCWLFASNFCLSQPPYMI